MIHYIINSLNLLDIIIYWSFFKNCLCTFMVVLSLKKKTLHFLSLDNPLQNHLCYLNMCCIIQLSYCHLQTGKLGFIFASISYIFDSFSLGTNQPKTTPWHSKDLSISLIYVGGLRGKRVKIWTIGSWTNAIPNIQ